jgi:hypothetical protein
VEAHPNADALAGGPRVVGVRALYFDGSRDGVACAGEGIEERIALRIDLDTASGSEALANEPPVLGKDVRVALAETLPGARSSPPCR